MDIQTSVVKGEEGTADGLSLGSFNFRLQRAKIEEKCIFLSFTEIRRLNGHLVQVVPLDPKLLS